MEFLGSPFESQVNSHYYHHIPLSYLENLQKVKTTLNHTDSNENIFNYTEMIMPLMFETWMELKPTQTKTIDGTNISSISHDSSIMLKIVMDTIKELYDMVDKVNENARQQFIKKYQEKFELYLVANFPYCQDDSSKKSPESGGEKCLYQNLNIAILFLTFTCKQRQRFWKHRSKIFDFIEDCINNWKPKDQEFNALMKRFIRTLFNGEAKQVFAQESKGVFSQLIRKCNVDQSSYDPKLALVCEIIGKSDDGGKKNSIYSELVPQMVQVLGHKEYVPVHIISTITTLAKQGNTAVFENLEKSIIDIIKHLNGKMKFSGNLEDANQWKKKIADLIFWVNNKEALQQIKAYVTPTNPMSSYLSEILNIKDC